MLTGPATNKDGDTIEVAGPNKNAAALRRTFSFVAPFDPSAPVKKAFFAMSEVLAAGRAAGLTNDDILSDDMTETGDVIPVTPTDPSAAGEVAFHSERGLLVRVRAGERVKVAMRPTQNEGVVVSGVALSADESAFLEVESSGVGHVFKVTASGVTDLFDINPTATDAMFYPANPDALAIPDCAATSPSSARGAAATPPRRTTPRCSSSRRCRRSPSLRGRRCASPTTRLARSPAGGPRCRRSPRGSG